ncbi:AKR_collapsed_G0026010.mRNA.1.CDS.1 [Saccharomyces cerevisiae]|nr:AKR_collapsed_G0026010.mRNA.1.CDS.1 [Saccharomyces cerevisiae]
MKDSPTFSMEAMLGRQTGNPKVAEGMPLMTASEDISKKLLRDILVSTRDHYKWVMTQPF